MCQMSLNFAGSSLISDTRPRGPNELTGRVLDHRGVVIQSAVKQSSKVVRLHNALKKRYF